MFNGEKMIVKVQASLFSSDGKRTFLIYNEDRSVMMELPVEGRKFEKMADRIIEDGGKAFYYATSGKDRFLHLGEEAPWQDW